MSDSLLDNTVLEQAKTTMKDKFSLMVTYYLEDAEVYVAQIKAEMEAGKPADITAPAHTLKSSSNQIGAVVVGSIAAQLEAIGRKAQEGEEPNAEEVLDLVQQLEEAFVNTKPLLESV